ncbi:MAG: TolC family outer membrane protein [Gammaproteobacteria bacterium]|jgi:outer membrane protein
MGPLVKTIGTALCCLLPLSLSHADDLAEILDLALNNDPTLRQARAQYRSNREVLSQGQAALLPTLSVGGTTQRQTAGPADSLYRTFTDPDTGETSRVRFANDMSFRPGQNSHGYFVNLSQALINLPAWYTFQSAKATDRAAAMNYAAQEQDLIFRVAIAYFDVLRAIDLLETNLQEEEAALRSLEQTRRREEVGLDTIIDVNDSQAAYDLARNTTILQRDILQASYESLEAITGRPHPRIEVLREDFPVLRVEGELEDWEAMAEDNSLAVAAAEYSLVATRETLRARKAAHLPTLSAGGSFSHFVTPSIVRDGVQASGGAFDQTNLSLTLSIPIYSGGAVSSRRRAAEYDVIAAQEGLELAKRQLTQNIRNTYRRVNTDVLVIAQRQQSIVSAQSALDQTELGVEVGQRNIVELLRARENLFRALREYAVARYDYVLDTLALKQVSGVLTPQDVLDLNTWLEEPETTVQ